MTSISTKITRYLIKKILERYEFLHITEDDSRLSKIKEFITFDRFPVNANGFRFHCIMAMFVDDDTIDCAIHIVDKNNKTISHNHGNFSISDSELVEKIFKLFDKYARLYDETKDLPGGSKENWIGEN